GAKTNIIGGTAPGAGNLISGNTGTGVRLSGSGTSGNLVQGNLIGTDVSGNNPLGNGAGVLIDAQTSGNTIGGTVAGAGNIIANNNGVGVQVGATVTDTLAAGNAILGNSIFANSGLGIDLGGDGATPNDPQDPDAGPNNLQNFPVITGALVGGGATN